MEKEFYISFDVKVTKYTPGGFKNILHFTTSGNGGHGQRIPGVWLSEDKKLHIMSSVNGDDFYKYNHDATPLKEGQWYRLEIQQVVLSGKVKRFYARLWQTLLFLAPLPNKTRWKTDSQCYQ